MHKVQFGYNCVLLLLGLITLSCGQQLRNLDKSHEKEFYRHEDTSSPIQYLPNGDSEYARLSLDTPLHFYDRRYKELFINTNGILSFNMEYPKYKNQSLPLELPTIAVFYSNVDTTNANASSSIYLFESQAPKQLDRANNLVHFAFPKKSNFKAQKLIVATWENVGYFNSKIDRLNTFQAILIVNDTNTFVQFIYPKNGINWLRGEPDRYGNLDVHAQAGFVAEDKRFYALEGSGSDKVRFLSESSNVGVEGVWLYHVGPVGHGGNVHTTNIKNLTLHRNRRRRRDTNECRLCSPDADCINGRCKCRDGYSGDGQTCVINCSHDETFENGICVTVLFNLPDKKAGCDRFGQCRCPDGYALMKRDKTCHFIKTDLNSKELESRY